MKPILHTDQIERNFEELQRFIESRPQGFLKPNLIRHMQMFTGTDQPRIDSIQTIEEYLLDQVRLGVLVRGDTGRFTRV